MTRFTTALIGNESLLIACAETLLDRGHSIAAVVSTDATIRAWAKARGIAALARPAELDGTLAPGAVDWLFSIANLAVIPDRVLALAAQGAINFHDGPLPEYAGLNTPVWALLNGKEEHGVTWHRIEGGIDEGRILQQRRFAIAEDETAYSLNAKCYAAALDSFAPLLDQLETGSAAGTPQDLAGREYFSRAMRPAAGGFIDLTESAVAISRLVRALDFAGYWNPVTHPKLQIGGQMVLVGKASIAEGDGVAAPGTVLTNNGTELTVATASGPIVLSGFKDSAGKALDVARLIEPGETIPALTADQREAIEAELAETAAHEGFWRRQLEGQRPCALPLATSSGAAAELVRDDIAAESPLPLRQRLAAAALLALQSCGPDAADLALHRPAKSPAVTDWVPLRITPQAQVGELAGQVFQAHEAAIKRGGFARDLVARAPEIDGLTTPDIAISESGDPVPGAALTVDVASETNLGLIFDASRLGADERALLTDRLRSITQRLETAGEALPLEEAIAMPGAERDRVLAEWNATTADFPDDLTVHAAFEAQAARDPDATALVFEDETLSYGALNRRANAAAQGLIAKGAKPGARIGLYVERSLDMLIGALAILKAGAAYVPLDPAYPADRIAHYIADSDAALVLTQSALAAKLPPGAKAVLEIDALGQDGDAANPEAGATGDDLAYLIYTSGSTGLPKGVMVSHRNVANFFTGMDAVVDREKGAVWLAVTSLSFDISVLELFYTLARGFKLVIAGGENRAAVSNGPIAISGRPIDFGLYYWGNDDGQGPKKYQLLLEGAKFADANGFNAVWTPERHFHAFGGPYPNPSVTGAAVAAVTSNVSVRAGSCVAPLHHPARIAEEWAIIDNLTNGRAGLGVASGWHPDDFVLRPENTPPKNRDAMFEAVEQVRALWRGEEVEFPTQSGTFGVKTQPRPVSNELDVWVTTAGNPATWREAGEKGANVLTHLLGQSIKEVGEKIKIYHAALQAAGHDPNDFKVTIMLHTFLAETREESALVAREPLKDYLRSAAGLIKQYAWAFPAFKRPKGVNNPFEMDIRDLGADEVEAILDFAFERYFEDSGMFGTVEDGVARAEQLKRIGVDEIACLIDYGIPSDQVMESLKPLAEVLRRANAPTELAPDDFSLAAQIIRHDVSHLQCTPSMARIIAIDSEARAALSSVNQLLLGGEALPGALVEDLRGCTNATIHNMYGPTETTIWSTHLAVTTPGAGTVGIGTPLANTEVYVLDDAGRPVPTGRSGELFIAGEGVTPGYWQQEALTEDRFPANPFGEGRMYRTGDIARWTAAGQLEFIGRADHQIKIRGQRIELGEIETRLAGFAGVREAIVIAREDTPGDLRLVGYYTASAAVAEAALRADLAAHLPEVMVPAHLVALEAFPLTPNRKIDRKALPAPAAATATRPKSEEAPPASDAEKTIAAIWARVLGVGQVGAADNFFALGGHSLLAVQAHREIKQALGATSLTITDIFRFPVLADLAGHISPDEAATAPMPDDGQKAETMSKRRAMRARRRERA